MSRFVLCALLLASCDSSTAEEAEPPKKEEKAKPAPKEVEPPPPPEPDPGPPTFAQQLEAIADDDPNAIPKAIDLFLERYTEPEPPVPEPERLESLEVLVKFVADGVRDPYGEGGLLASGALGTAACMRSDKCDRGEPTLAAQETLAALESRGIKLLFTSDRKFVVVPDHDQIAKRLSPALPEPAVDYLHALLWESQKVDAGYDAQGFIADPRKVAEALHRWEVVGGAGGPVYGAKGAQKAAAMAERFLRLCLRKGAEPVCSVTRAHYGAYKRFAKDYRGSAFRPGVLHFVDKAKGAGSKLDAAQLDALVAESMAQVKAEP